MIIQDSFIDALGGMVVYAPMDLNTAYSAVSGQVDPAGISILPSGFIISRDGRPSAAAELDGGRDHCTTLLTVAFQILVSGLTYADELNMEESTATVNTLISSTVQRIKAMLNCDDGQWEFTQFSNCLVGFFWFNNVFEWEGNTLWWWFSNESYIYSLFFVGLKLLINSKGRPLDKQYLCCCLFGMFVCCGIVVNSKRCYCDQFMDFLFLSFFGAAMDFLFYIINLYD